MSYNTDLYELLQNEAFTGDELTIKADRPAAEIMVGLTVTLLKGEVLEREGKYYVSQ